MSVTLLEEQVTSGSERGMVTPMMGRHGSAVQRDWATRPISQRLQVIRRARNLLAEQTESLCAAVPAGLARNAADTMCAEILPLLAAMKFLETDAQAILRLRHVGEKGRPIWLAGVVSEVSRAPMGHVLVIAPSNYALFLPGVQVVQALAAGNAATWKPGSGGRRVALLFAQTMRAAGLPEGLLRVTDETVQAAREVIASGVDKVFFTGSADSGRTLLKQLAETLTPCVAELSGCDAVFVLPSANIPRLVKALAFGMRLNGSATCMAPRRIILVGASDTRRDALVSALLTALGRVMRVALEPRVKQQLALLLHDAEARGAQVHGGIEDFQRPVLVTNALPSMQLTQADIFAPVLSLMEARSIQEALAINEACPYALTAGIFGYEKDALALAAEVNAGTVTINDLMLPAADPRTPFGGRRSSGFGTTQGSEGLLEMTTPKTVAVRRGRNTRHFDATTQAHEPFFRGILRATHSDGWRERLAGLRDAVSAARKLND